MSKVENFETKIYSDENGWKIWLCTERSEWNKVESFFKFQYPVKGTPQRDTRILVLNGYYDTLSAVNNALKNRHNFVHYAVGTTYSPDEFSNRFLELIKETICDGSLQNSLREHNRKTLHQAHLIPCYSLNCGDREFTIYHDHITSTLAKFAIQEKPEGGYQVQVLCIGEIGGKVFKTNHTFTDKMLRPESLSNAVFKVLNPLLDKIKMDNEERKDIVADITHTFEQGRFGFWHLLNLINK